MPQVMGTARLSPRSSVSGRLTPSLLARRCVSDSQTPSSTRSPSRASCPTLHVPSARRSRTSTAPINQIAARMATELGRERPTVVDEGAVTAGALASAAVASLPITGWARPDFGAIGADALDDLLLSRSGIAVLVPIAGAEEVCCIHGAAGSTGIVHAGKMKTSAGIARWPMTAAVHTA